MLPGIQVVSWRIPRDTHRKTWSAKVATCSYPQCVQVWQAWTAVAIACAVGKFRGEVFFLNPSAISCLFYGIEIDNYTWRLLLPEKSVSKSSTFQMRHVWVILYFFCVSFLPCHLPRVAYSPVKTVRRLSSTKEVNSTFILAKPKIGLVVVSARFFRVVVSCSSFQITYNIASLQILSVDY